jgi:exopolysaccharide biosynthesis polyprenyl glycosylphosphotransferase
LAIAGFAVVYLVHMRELAWLLCCGVFLVLFDRIAQSPTRIRSDWMSDLRNLLAGSVLAGASVLAIRLLLSSTSSAGSDTVRTAAAATLLLGSAKLVGRVRARRLGRAGEPTLIIGAGQVGQLTAKRLIERPEFGLSPIGFLDKEPLIENGGTVLPVLGASWDLDEVIRKHGVRRVIFTFSTAPHDVMLQMLSRCQQIGVAVSVVPRLFERVGAKIGVDHIGGLPLISVHTADPRGWRFRLKYIVDRIAAAALLFLLSPVLIACAITVWLLDGRPIFYRQQRVGRDGHEFEILKFRSMSVHDPNADDRPDLPWDTAPGGTGDVDRRTRSGSFLRDTSFDELPQLINVLRGEMSLVGPRPERPEFTGAFEEEVHRYRDRLRVKPGITGWAQVHGLRGPTSLSDRAEWDNYYIENWSLGLDVRILVTTLWIVLGFRQ